MQPSTAPLDIICLSTAVWDAPLWTNRQRLMNILSERHRVLFVEPGLFAKEATRELLANHPGQALPWRWFRQVKPHLWVYSPHLLPLYRFDGPMQQLAWWVGARQIRTFCRQQGFKRPVLWLYTPAALPALGTFNESIVVYDCVDNYAATPYYRRVPARVVKLNSQETELIDRADVVTTTSQSLYNTKSANRSNVHFVPNVGESAHFQRALDPNLDIPADIAAIPHPIVGFVGAVNSHKVDYALVCHAAEANPDFHFVLIGPVGGWSDNAGLDLLARPNIHLLGHRDYAVLPNYVKAFDICMIPYALNEYTNDVFPLKFYEFLATGKPLVTTALPSLVPYSDLIYVAHDLSDFSGHLVTARQENDTALRQRRIELASHNTWEHRAETIEALIFAAQSQPAGEERVFTAESHRGASHADL